MSEHTQWAQGRFIDKPEYSKWSDSDKERANEGEKYLVRPSPTGNAICRAMQQKDAAFIAKRLNLAAQVLNKGFVHMPTQCDDEVLLAMDAAAIDTWGPGNEFTKSEAKLFYHNLRKQLENLS